MTALADLQSSFQARILTQRAPLEAHLSRPAQGALDERIGAYVGGYRARLLEALQVTYTALQSTLGEEHFERRMRDYIEAHPSTHYSIRYYGAGVAGLFEGAEDPAAAATLGELARWEWLLAEVFDAPDDTAIDTTALAAVPPACWGGLRLRLRASVRRMQTHSNAVEFWRAANGQGAKPAAYASAPPVSWLVWRRGVSTFFRSLEPLECLALDAAAAGESFECICERLAGPLEEEAVALRAASLLRGWFAEELIAGVSLPDASR